MRIGFLALFVALLVAAWGSDARSVGGHASLAGATQTADASPTR